MNRRSTGYLDLVVYILDDVHLQKNKHVDFIFSRNNPGSTDKKIREYNLGYGPFCSICLKINLSSVPTMVHILDGNSAQVVRVCRKNAFAKIMSDLQLLCTTNVLNRSNYLVTYVC